MGEAQNPGPFAAMDLDSEAGSHLVCIGTANVAGLSNKVELTSTLPSGLWGLTETQLTVGGQRRVRNTFRQYAADRHARLRVVLGAGAPARSLNSDAGTWTDRKSVV